MNRSTTALLAAVILFAGPGARAADVEEYDWKNGMVVAEVERDGQGSLLPLQSYDETVRRGMSFILDDHLSWFKAPGTLLDENGKMQMPWVYYSNVQHNGAPFPDAVDRFTSYPAFHHALMIRTLLGYYTYAKDPRALDEAVKLADWDIAHSTPGDWAYGNMPYSTFEHKKPGGFRDGAGIMPDKAAILALAYLDLYEASGRKRFLKAGEAIAKTLSLRQRPDGTWPFRVDPKTERVVEEYTSSVIYAVMLFERLDQLNGNSQYRPYRDKTWNWLVNGPIRTKEFRGFYEDIPASPKGRTNYDCLDTIRYLLANRTDDNGYLEMAKELNVWIENTFLDRIKGFEPAEGIREQLQCNVVMGIHSLNWASMLLELAQATGDENMRQRAMQTANYTTYYLQPDNRIVVGFQYNQWWYSCHAGVVLYLFDFLDAGSADQSQVRQEKSNVVLILIDDLGWADLGLTGSTFYETPNVDALAKEGVFFSNAYAASPVCSPTRASIMTGKYPSRIGMSSHSGSKGPWGEKHRLVPPEVAGNMPLEDITLAEALKEAGYTTAHVGKWHLQAHYQHKERTYFPEANGFDINIAGHRMGQPGSYYFPYTSEQHPSTNVPDMEDGAAGDYLTDALTDKAIDFIESNADKPFFLNMWYYTVHTPINPRKDKLEKYRKKAAALKKKEGVPEHQSMSRAQQDSPEYACMVESMDENIGRILGTLKRLDLEKDTLVVFFSDNGGLSTGNGPNMPTSCLPLRAGKAWIYEGGIRVPMIIKLPGKAKAGLKVDEPVVSTDLYPTILELAGLPLRPEQHVDGVSLEPLLTGKSKALNREAIYFHYPHYHHINSMGPAGAVRMGDYKLVEVYETGRIELYNLHDDIGEQKNLAAEMPELAARMKKMLHDWRTESGSKMAVPNPDYQAADDWRR